MSDATPPGDGSGRDDATPPGDGSGGDGRGGDGSGGDGSGGDGIGRGDADGTEGAEVRQPHPLRANWRQPVLTLIGMSVVVGLLALIDPRPAPLVLAAVLAMTISRNKLVRTWRGRIEALVLLPFVGLATAGVGYLLLTIPIVGASAYVVAMFLSIFLRRFGPVWTRVGSLIALPFITLLIAPHVGSGTPPLEVASLSVGVLVTVVVLRVLAEATHFVPTDPKPFAVKPTVGPAGTEPGNAKSGNAKPLASPSTRMAIQMAIALAAAFVPGALVFPEHVTWVVLTAFIVCSGNRGRADVLYKSGLRIVGAAVGTIVASVSVMWLTPAHPLLQGPLLVVTLLVIIGVGLWLREWTYAAWAVVMTLVITLLQGVAIHGGAVATGQQLWIRILAIIVGALCGVAASWFVLPVRSEGVVRRRIADALAALSTYLGDRNPVTDDDLVASLDRLDEIAAPWNALERVTAWRKTLRKPGEWIALVHESVALVRSRPQVSGGARRALGDARKSMRDPEAIGPKLLALRDELQGASREEQDGSMTQQEQPGQQDLRQPSQPGQASQPGQPGPFEQLAEPGEPVRALAAPQPHPELEQLIAVLEQLRAPGGCAWDAEQTHESLVRYLIEETYELIDAIESGNRDELIEELGDVLYQVIFHSDIAAHTPGEEFTLEDVAAHMTAKMVGRHPHVYGELASELAEANITDTAADVNARWDEIKKIEKPTRTSVLDGVPQGMPALALADKLLGKAAKLGMPAPESQIVGDSGAEDEDVLGEQLLAIVAMARAKGLDSERALRAALRTLQKEVRVAESL